MVKHPKRIAASRLAGKEKQSRADRTRIAVGDSLPGADIGSDLALPGMVNYTPGGEGRILMWPLTLRHDDTLERPIPVPELVI
jgi:hypothetical protein